MKYSPKTKVKTRKVIAMKKSKVSSKSTSRKKKAVIKINRKMMNYAVFLLALIFVIVVIAVVYQRASTNISTDINPIQTSANSLKTQAIQLLHTDPTKAKTLFQQAREKYLAISDRNNVIDVEAQLFLIDHAKAIK